MFSCLFNPPSLRGSLLPVVAEAVPPGVALAAEGGLRLTPALVLPSPPGPGPDHLAPAPAAAPAPTHDPGLFFVFLRSCFTLSNISSLLGCVFSAKYRKNLLDASFSF